MRKNKQTKMKQEKSVLSRLWVLDAIIHKEKEIQK